VHGSAPTPARRAGGDGDHAPLRLLLVEDDDGDALIVTELLADEDDRLEVERARSVAEAGTALADGPIACVLLDLGLPDAVGLDALERLRDTQSGAAIVVLTGDGDEERGTAAVAAGAEDYLVKGQVDGRVLVRAVRYAVERRQAAAVRQELRAAQIQAQEATRLERGLLPVPILPDTTLTAGAGYRPGRQRTLLGGDFYDAIQTPDGAVRLLIGDVCGHGPDEAALGVCLRVAWRTLVLNDAPDDDVLPTLERVVEHERHASEVFATVATVRIAPGRDVAHVRSAGHPPPLLLGPDGAVPCPPVPGRLPVGVLDGQTWPAVEVPLPPQWGVLLFTDGLIEGHAEPGGHRRLGVDGLTRIVGATAAARDWRADPDGFVAALIDELERRNERLLLDDLAALLLVGSRRP
jgi:serine phosphatase RsbU (regulator of sigma subunit)